MKRVSLIAVMLVAATFSAVAQNSSAGNKPTVSYSGVYYKDNKLHSKTYASVADGNIRTRGEHVDEKTGEPYIIIIRMDSMAMYTLYPKTKTGNVMSVTSLMNIGNMGGNKVKSTKTELKGRANIEGYDCGYYIDYTVTELANGREEQGCFEYWLYEPLGVQMQYKEACGYDTPITLKNFQQGAQPDHLFEIPKDYKLDRINFDALQKQMESFEDVFKKLNEAADTTKSQGQQIQDLLKLLNSTNKKE